MNKGILLITVILLFPAPGLASLSEAHKADELRLRNRSQRVLALT